ncbi:Phasin [Pseudogemmobacter faecipullorum]|uniref:Phasin n=1 Tax=Pseudogemmobacter faecipullorum TaxID=2755041 RepID=A0ABS8CKJ5_9RHOB|nr:Phasin [Pseudogemmobacter faecipullorum]MCB5409906.1 Phasin [Pseudogemmobacter faecipullorum]
MTKTPDFAKLFQEALTSFPVDASAFQNAFKSQAAFGEKFSKVALEAAEKSTEISAAWAKATLTRLGDIASAKAEPADYPKALSDFASKAAELAAENMAAFAEVAKKVQAETVELMLAAGKEASDDATAAVKKAASEVQGAAKKAAAAAK